MCYLKHLITLLFFFPFTLAAQDITGLWKGTLYNDTTGQFYSYEVGISQEKGKLSGFSHTWFILGDKKYFGVKKVSVKKAADGKIIIEDDGLISNNYPVPPSKNVRQLNVLTLDAADSIMTLKGPFTTNRTKEYHSLTGKINLQRKNDFWQSALVPHLQELGLENKLSFVKEETDLLAYVEAKQDEATFKQLEQDYKNHLKSEEIKAKPTSDHPVISEKPTQNKPLPEMTAVAVVADNKTPAQAEKEKKELAKKEMAQQQADKKELAKKELAQQQADKKALEEKIKTEKKLAKEAETANNLAVKNMAKQPQPTPQPSAGEQESKALATKTSAPGPKVSTATKSVTVTAKVSKAPAVDVSLRKTIVQKTVAFTSDSLLLTLYDNGEVDGDTVSVLMNGKLIIAKQGLSTTAFKHTLYIPSGTNEVELVMYAESLGAIPPNTGLLVIRDGKDIYEIRFSGDLQKNASIIFSRKKE